MFSVDIQCTPVKAALLRRLNVAMIMQPQCTVIHDDTPLQEVIKKAADLEVADFIVVDHDNNYVGLLTARDFREALLQPEAVPFLVAGELARVKVPLVSPQDTLDEVMDKFSRLEVNSLPVHSEYNDKEYIGMVTRAALMRRYQQELQAAV